MEVCLTAEIVGFIAALFLSIVTSVSRSKRGMVPAYLHRRAVDICTYPALDGALSIMQSLPRLRGLDGG
jgi:hypothetical protein